MKALSNYFRLFVLIAVAATLLSACSDGGGSANEISGQASKGPIIGGSVEVYSLQFDGSKDKLLGTATTSADGSFNVGVGGYSGSVLVEVIGGMYIDEATGLAVSNYLMRAAIPAVKGAVSVSVTPLTELAVANSEATGGLTTDNIIASNTAISDLFGGIDIIATEPVDVLSTPKANVTQDEIDYGLMLAAISQMVSNASSTTDVTQVIQAMVEDLADGTLDVTGGELITALTDFVSSGNNATSVITIDEMTIDDVVASQVPWTGLSELAPYITQSPTVSALSVAAGNSVDITVFADGPNQIYGSSVSFKNIATGSYVPASSSLSSSDGGKTWTGTATFKEIETPAELVVNVELGAISAVLAGYNYDDAQSTTNYYVQEVNEDELWGPFYGASPFAVTRLELTAAPNSAEYFIETFANGTADSANTVLTLLNGTGTAALTGNSDIAYPDNLFSQIQVRLVSGNTYYIRVDASYTPSLGAVDQGAYSIRISDTGFGGTSIATPGIIDDGYEPDNDIANAVLLELNVVQDHNINGNSDYFKFVAP